MTIPIHPLTYKEPDFQGVNGEVTYVGNHPDVVLEWREREFRRFGYAPGVADNLAEGRIDLHMMEDLLDRGATLDQALRILSGTTWFGEDTPMSESSYDQAVLEAPVAS